MVRCDECRELVNEAEVEDALAGAELSGLSVEDLHRSYLTVFCADCSRTGKVEIE